MTSVSPRPEGESPLGVDAVRIDVTDQGIGIPPDELQRIFDEFYQTEEGRRARRGGTGLGPLADAQLRRAASRPHRRAVARPAKARGSRCTCRSTTDGACRSPMPPPTVLRRLRSAEQRVRPH